MIAFSYLVPKLGGAVDAYLTVIGIMDMPLFVVAIFYGLLWKRTNWQGAIAGYLAGAIAGCYAKFYLGADPSTATFYSAGAALLVCPLASILSRPVQKASIEHIWRMKSVSDEEIQSGSVYHLMPQSVAGKIFLGVLLLGLLLFLSGIYLGSQGLPHAGFVSVTGVIIYFAGGLARLSFD